MKFRDYLIYNEENNKSFDEIRKEYPEPNHHLKLKCKRCGSTETCRCKQPKKEIIGICNRCNNVEN